jgi:hypothetical protein
LILLSILTAIIAITFKYNLLNGLFKSSKNAVIVIELTASKQKYETKFNLNNYQVAKLSEEFCKARLNEGVISSKEDMATSCVPIIQNFFIDKLQTDFNIDPKDINMGSYSEEILSYHKTTTTSSSASSTTTTTNADTTIDISTSSTSKTMTVPIQWGTNNQVYSLDLTEPIVLFTSSEAFCKFMSNEMKVEESDRFQFLGDCVIPVAERILESLTTTHGYPGDQINRGEFSPELKSWAEKIKNERDANKEKEKIRIPIQWPDNNVEYAIELAEPILIYPAAESFCRFLLGELQIGEDSTFYFLNRCLEPIVHYVEDKLKNNYNVLPELIATGEFSNELKQFFDINVKMQQEQQQQEQQQQEQQQQQQQQQQQETQQNP